MFGLEFFLVLGALLFFFTCYQVIKIGLKILEEIQDNLSEVKRVPDFLVPEFGTNCYSSRSHDRPGRTQQPESSTAKLYCLHLFGARV